MKKIIVCIVLLMYTAWAFAATASLNGKSHGVKVLSNTDSALELEYGIQSLNLQTVKSTKGVFTSITVDKGGKTLNFGEPALPVFGNLIEIPAGAEPSFEVLSYDEKDYQLKDLGIENQIAPSQPSVSKYINAKKMEYAYNNTVYQKNSYTGDKMVKFEKSGNLRGVEIGNLTVSPFKYNPVTKTLKVFNNLKIKVNFKNGNPEKSRQAKTAAYSPYFEGVYSTILNFKDISSKQKADLSRYPVTYLILAAPGTQTAKFTEFVNWKKQKGFNVIVRSVTAGETVATLDAWVDQQYNTLTPKPTFLLIVGDCDGTYAVPTVKTGLSTDVTVSDLTYGVTGTASSSNRIQSLYVGRFSVRSTADLDAQIDKTLWYEKGQFAVVTPDLNYLKKPMGVAGDTSTDDDPSYGPNYGDPQIRYGWEYYFNNTYTNPTTNATNGMPDAIKYMSLQSNAAASTIRSTVSSGVNFYNYTAHGDVMEFYAPNFTNTHVNALTNTGKYPLIIGNCCLSGSFGDTECFGEAWLTAPNKGAIGFIGNCTYSYWDEDLVQGTGENVNGPNQTPAFTPNSEGMYDGVMNRRYITQGAMRFTGLLAIEGMASSSFKLYYWQMNHLLGDPSLMPYFGIPGTPTAAHGTLTSFATTFTVTTNPNAYVAISDAAGVLHGAAIANSSGIANLTITPFSSGGTAKLVVTGQQLRPYFEDIVVSSITYPIDAGVTSVISPVSGANMTNAETVKVNVKNFGTNAITSGLTVSYKINGGNAVTESFTGSLAANAAADFTFATKVNLSSAGTYTIEVYTNITGDGNTANNSMSVTVVNSVTGGLPFSENFDGSWTTPATLVTAKGNSWSGTGDAASEWHRNDYTTGWSYASSGSSSASGAVSTANYARFHSYGVESSVGEVSLITPAINMSGTNTKDLEFYYINKSGTDVLKVYLSTDDGATYSASLLNCGVATSWTKKTVSLGSVSSGLAKVKFGATSDYGDDDIGVDQVSITAAPSAIDGIPAPQATELYQNYPNPFNPTTTISFFAKEAGSAFVSVYNQKGELIETLAKGNVASGLHSINFNASSYASGIYFYHLNVNGKVTAVKKMILCK